MGVALAITGLTPVVVSGQTAPAPVPASPVAPAAAADEPVEHAAIVVTGSRICAAGYTAPTPVTVVGEEIILRDAGATIGDSIRELPAVGASASPNNTSGAGNIVAGMTGLDTVNLRNLGVIRTLVLFDGQRVVQSNVTGQHDIGTIPTTLVQRIDVVTAGASAAWGSDAVAGVVNLVLNKKFEGVRGSIEAGDTDAFDRFNCRARLALGTAFADDNGRAVITGNWFDTRSNVFANQRRWNTYAQLASNPAFAVGNGQPRLIHADNVNLAGATTGGLIVGSCRLALTAAGACSTGGSVATGSLINQQFTGAGGVLAPFPRTNDPGAQARAYSVANFSSFKGKYEVKEGFIEANVPIIKDGFVDSIDFSAAARLTDYSTSGSVVTWKLGLTADLTDAIGLRCTVSRDMRAPNLNELFSTGLSTLSSAVSPGTGTTVSIFTFASGDANLQPEVARTYSAGIVLRPANRRNISIDYYNINLSDAIVCVGSNDVLTRCNAGETVFCSQLVFQGPIGSNGLRLLSQINTFPENIASLKTSGIDYQADYTFPVGSADASVQLRLLGNHILKLQQKQLGATFNLAGAIGPDNPGGTGFPRALHLQQYLQ